MWFLVAIFVVALLAVAMAPKPKVENARAANFGDFTFPRAKEGDPVPWFRGTMRFRSPNTGWYGDYKPYAIKQKQPSGLFGSKKVTVGYKYHMGVQLIFGLNGRAEVTLRKLWSDKYVIWEGAQSTQGSITINLPDLFGGEKERGGLRGIIDFYPGTFTQTRNTYMAQKAHPDVPAYVGQIHLVFRAHPFNIIFEGATGFYWGTTPSVNPINAEISCLSRDLHATYSVMPNGLDQNPMELLYQAFTQKFGMAGLTAADIDLPSWTRDAETLYNEGLGMGLLVQASVTGKDICEEVLRVADGIIYQDPDTGKMVSRLIRQDYDIDTLPVVDESIIKELGAFNKTTWEQTYNQCRVIYRDRSQDYAEKAATEQDFANINFQQRVKNTDISMPTVFINDEAQDLAARQLSLLSVPLFQVEIRCNRRASKFKPGDVFKMNYAPDGISNLILRVQKIDKGTLKDGTVAITCVQDRFAAATAVFAPPSGSTWEPIDTAAKPVIDRFVSDVPWWFSQFYVAPPTDAQGIVQVLATPPGSASVGFDVESTVGTDSLFTSSNVTTVGLDLPYLGSATVKVEYPRTAGWINGLDNTLGMVLENSSFSGLLTGNVGFDQTGNQMFYANGEYFTAQTVTDNADGTITLTNVRRALLDTEFKDHPVGSRVYLVSQASNLLEAYYSSSSWRFRYFDKTPGDTLEAADATSDPYTVPSPTRLARPAPPDNLRVNNSRTQPQFLVGNTVTLAWTVRNRKTTSLVAYTASSETPEAGQTYQWRTRVDGGAWSSFTNVPSGTVASFVVNVAGVWEAEVYSLRDGIQSYTPDRVFFDVVNNIRVTEAGDRRITEDNNPRATE